MVEVPAPTYSIEVCENNFTDDSLLLQSEVMASATSTPTAGRG